MSETRTEYRVIDERLKTGQNRDMLQLTLEERAYLLELRGALLHGLVMIERKLGIEPSVKTRAEKRAE